MAVVSNNAKGQLLSKGSAGGDGKPKEPTVEDLKQQLIESGQDKSEVSGLKKADLLERVAQLQTSAESNEGRD